MPRHRTIHTFKTFTYRKKDAKSPAAAAISESAFMPVLARVSSGGLRSWPSRLLPRRPVTSEICRGDPYPEGKRERDKDRERKREREPEREGEGEGEGGREREIEEERNDSLMQPSSGRRRGPSISLLTRLHDCGGGGHSLDPGSLRVSSPPHLPCPPPTNPRHPATIVSTPLHRVPSSPAIAPPRASRCVARAVSRWPARRGSLQGHPTRISLRGYESDRDIAVAADRIESLRPAEIRGNHCRAGLAGAHSGESGT